jgi:lysyl-tRNA synthetase class II
MAVRGQGAILFVVLDDGKGTFQAVVKKDVLNPALFELFNSAVDIGDIKIGEVRGDRWTADEIHKTFSGRNWKSRLCAEIDAAITMAMERRGATW